MTKPPIKSPIHPREFLDAIDDARVLAAIHRAEAHCGAIIRVHVSHQSVPDAAAAARHRFQRVKDPKPNSGRVLIFVAPKSRTFAIHGDGIAHTALGSSGWNSLLELLATHFKAGDYTSGLVAAIERIAARLG